MPETLPARSTMPIVTWSIRPKKNPLLRFAMSKFLRSERTIAKKVSPESTK